MFTFADEGKVWWRVNLVARDPDGGEPADAPVLLLFRIYTRAELKTRERGLSAAVARVTKTMAGSGKPEQANVADSIAESLRSIETAEEEATADLIDRTCDWKQLVDANGEPVKFSKSLLKKLLNDDAQYPRVMAGLIEASRGARIKNSSPGAAGTRAPGLN